MTVDGIILENLIRELIRSEFANIIQTTNRNKDEISRIQQRLTIESQKSLDTGARLKRLDNDFLQKQISDKQQMAKKSDLTQINDDLALLRDYMGQI